MGKSVCTVTWTFWGHRLNLNWSFPLTHCQPLHMAPIHGKTANVTPKSYLSLLRSTREDPRHTKMIFIVLVQGEQRKMCLSTRRRSCQDPLSGGGSSAWENRARATKPHVAVTFVILLFLRLFPLDYFPSNADSFGTSWTAWEQNIHTFCFQAGIRINCPLNTATN